MDGERAGHLCAGANLRFHNIVLEKVFLVFVVVFAFPVLGSHFAPQQKDTMFPASRKVMKKKKRESVSGLRRAEICVFFTGAQLLLSEDVER